MGYLAIIELGSEMGPLIIGVMIDLIGYKPLSSSALISAAGLTRIGSFMDRNIAV